MLSAFIEQNCVIELNGQKFESGGAWLSPCGRGVVYAASANWGKEGWGEVTTWHGEKIASAYFGRVYRGNFCKMQSVSFTLDGVKYTGRYCPDWSQAIRVRRTK